ncbi:MAG TPA: hypothetical protein VJL28_06435 [Gemmatimonadaceae bacterium]|nr:hypothetical protein [Gemmatimonadaceae bacterium]
MLLRRLVALAAAAFPAATGAQIIRDPAAIAASADSTSPAGMGRRAQAEFERFRREHLPAARSGRPARCDEQVGRFCYWYNEREPPPPREPASVTEKRQQFLRFLDSLARVSPDDRWITGQRVRYLAEAERFGDALTAAHECRVGGWWCDLLVGFSLHLLGEYVAADSVYASALTKMLPRDRCEWRSLELLIDDDTRQQYRRLPCGDPRRVAFEDRIWFLARTLYAMPGNDSRTEYYARMTMTLMLTDAPSLYQFGFDEDERELLLRFGWPRAWAATASDPRARGYSIVGMEPMPAYRYIPPGFVLNSPPVSDSTNWRLQLPPVIGRYAPPYARTLKPLEHQKAMFRRGDSALVLLAYDARATKELADATVHATLAITAGDAPRGWLTTRRDAPQVGVLTAKAPWGPLLMSAEVTAPERQAVARARYGLSPPYAVGVRVTLSDLLFYQPHGTFPKTVEEVLPHALPTERLRASEKLGVYWESYGTDPTGEKMSVSLTVVREVEESGFLRRQARALRLVREATPVSVSVQDVSARGTTVSPRALELDISTLSRGAYFVQLEIDVAGQYVIRADHRIEIIGP